MNQREQAVWQAIRFSGIAIAVFLIGAMVYTGIRAPRAISSPTPTKTPTAVARLSGSTPTATVESTAEPTVVAAGTAMAAGTAAVPTEPPTAQSAETATATVALTMPPTPPPTATSWANHSPLPAHTPAALDSPLPTPILLPAAVAPTAMFVCGYDRCQDSGEYGKLSFDGAISAWQNHEPDRGGVQRELFHGDEVQVVAKVLVHDGLGGLWFQLAGGGWISEVWLTEERCTADNLDAFSFERCAGDED